MTTIQSIYNTAKTTLENFNETEVTVLEEGVIIASVEAFTTAAVVADTKLRGSFLQKIRVKTSSAFREKERVRLETLLLLSLIGINIGINTLPKIPQRLKEFDLNKVIKVLFTSLIRRGFTKLDLPTKALEALK